MLSHIAHGGTIYLQNGSINALAKLPEVYDAYDVVGLSQSSASISALDSHDCICCKSLSIKSMSYTLDFLYKLTVTICKTCN